MEKEGNINLDLRIMPSSNKKFERAGIMKITKKSATSMSMNDVQRMFEDSLHYLEHSLSSGMQSGYPMHRMDYSPNRMDYFPMGNILPVIVIVEVQNEVVKYMPTYDAPSAMMEGVRQIRQLSYISGVDPYETEEPTKESKSNTNNLTLLL